MKAIPMELKEANEFVAQLHRHHDPVHRDKFRVGCVDDNGKLVGVIQMARPVARRLDDGKTIEVVRLCTDGTRNACSFLYSRGARIAKEMGYTKIITYILKTETGASLKASGWILEDDDCGGTSWNVPSRPRYTGEEQISLFEVKRKYPNEKKAKMGEIFIMPNKRKNTNSQIEDYICKTYRNEFYRKILRERFINDRSYVGILLRYDPVYHISSDGVRRHKEKRLRLFCQKFYEKMERELEND